MIPSRTIPILITLALLLAGCLPAALEDATPDAAVLGAPADARVPGAADALHARLADLPTGHDLVGRTGLSFREVRSGLVGRRTPGAAADLARTVGAEVAVLISARTLEREVVGSAAAPSERVTLQLEVRLLDAADARELARVRGPRLSDERRLEGDELPELGDDRLVRDLVRRGVERLAPRVADELRGVGLSGSSGG